VLLKPASEALLNGYAEDSAILWNTANFERRRAWRAHLKMPSYASQCRTLKTSESFKRLGTCKAQALLSKLNEAWSSFYALKRLEKRGRLPPHVLKVNPPRYWKEGGRRVAKGFYVRNDGWRWTGEDELVIGKMRFPFQHGKLWVGKRGRLEVLHDGLSGKWRAYFPVDVPLERSCRVAGKMASLDLGICNLAALYIEDEKPIVYSGRAVLSDWVYRTKKIGMLQSRLPWKQRGSQRIALMFRRRQRRLKHAVNAMCRSIFEELEKRNVSVLVMGDLNGIRTDANHGRRGNQKLHNFWAFSMIQKRLTELGEEHGTIVRKVSERFTSKTCCLCGFQHNGRVHRGLMVCPQSHMSVNADVNGALNIWNVAADRFPQSLAQTERKFSGSTLLAECLLLRWNYNEWK
jgi:putative transposase